MNIVYCDGACSGNPGPGGWGVIVITKDKFVCELGGSKSQTTNNQMELLASIRSLEFLKDEIGDVKIFTDSKYVIQGITQWIKGWEKNHWKTADKKPVKNKELWMSLKENCDIKKQQGYDIFWQHVSGHSGIAGNERADEIAVNFVYDKNINLYVGLLKDYPVSLSL